MKNLLLCLSTLFYFNSLSAQTNLPKELLGDFFSADGTNRWELTLSEKFVVYESEFWSYENIQQNGDNWVLQLVQPNRTENIKVRLIDNGLILSKPDVAVKLFREKMKENRVVLVDETPWSEDFLRTGQVSISGIIMPRGEMPLTAAVIFNHPYSEDQQKYTASVDGEGRFKLFFPLDNPQSVMFTVGEVFTSFLAEPESKMALLVEEKEAVDGIDRWYAETPISFMGNLAKENEELRVVQPEYMKVRKYFENDSLQKALEPMDYLEYRIDLFNSHTQFYNDYFETNSLSLKSREFALRDVRVYAVDDLMRYRWLHNSGSGPIQVVDLPDEYLKKIYSMMSDEPLDMLATDYASLMRGFTSGMMPKEQKETHEYRMGIVYDFLMGKAISESNKALVNYWKSEEVKREKHFGYVTFPDSVKTFTDQYQEELALVNEQVTWDMLLKRINDFDKLSKSSIIATYIDQSYFHRGKEVPDVIWAKVHEFDLDQTALQVMDQKYEDFNLLKTKKFVEGIELVDSEVDVLNQLKEKYAGKVIYIDVWATWCGPCLSEFKNLPSLKANFEENEEIVFVYLCAQSDKKGWETMIKKYDLKGENFFLDDGQYAKFDQLVNITGFPTYMVITKQGKLVREGIKRPSAGKDLVNQLMEFSSRK
uniref:TlpA family protein disulfide reductase n=1 Tax=Roseivirga sp. TaxID=1964215 RepID=UPI004047E417